MDLRAALRHLDAHINLEATAGRIEGLSLDRMRALVDAGLFGLELDHRDNPASGRAHWADLAQRFGLVTTGSSDYHGTGKPNRLAENTTAPEVYAAIVARATGTRPFRTG